MNESGRMDAGQPEFSAYVAVDWGDREHYWAGQEANGRRKTGKFAHTPEAIETWAADLAARFGGRVAVALEQARGALFYTLSRFTHLVLFPIHPTTSARYRAAMFPSGAKDDPKDAELLLDLLVHHRERLRPAQPDTPAIRKLQLLVEKRRQLVDERTAATNRITAQLKICFPQALDWFDSADSPLFVDFLRRWPTLAAVQSEQSEVLLSFLRSHNCRSEELNQRRLREIADARPMIEDAALIKPSVIVIATLLDVVEALRSGIARLERSIEEVCADHPDYHIFASFPAAGANLAPRLLAAFGSLRERFASAGDMQTFSGIAPVISRSGRTCWTHFRWACPKFLRQTFHEYAGVSIQYCEWARAFYDRQKKKGKGHHAAVRSLAYKWIRILFACWRDRVPYVESRHLQAIGGRQNAPQPSSPTPPVDFTWESSAGFSKFSFAKA